MSERNQLKQAADLMVSAIEQLLSLSLPANPSPIDGEQIGPLSRWKTRYVHRIDGDMANICERHRTGRWAVNIKPPEEEETNESIKASERLFQAIYGEYPLFALEIAEVEDQLQYRAIVFSRQDADKMVNRVMSLTDCVAEIEAKPKISVEKGDYAAISKIQYTRDHLLPVAHGDSENYDEPYKPLLDTIAGEWDGQTNIQLVCEPSGDWSTRWARGIPFETDRNVLRAPPERGQRLPGIVFMSILSATVTAWWILDKGALTVAHAATSIQLTAARAALFGLIMLILTGLWMETVIGHGFGPHRITAKRAGELLRSKPWTENKTTKTERSDVDPIAKQGSTPGYRVSMRVLTTAETQQTAAGYHRRVTRTLRNAWHNPATGQTFSENPVGWPSDRSFRQMIEKIATRSPDRDRRQRISDKLLLRAIRPFPMFMSKFELSSVMRWPGRSAGGASIIEFTTTKTEEPDAQADEFAGKDESEPDATTITNDAEPQPQTDPVSEPITNDAEPSGTIEAEPVEVNHDDR